MRGFARVSLYHDFHSVMGSTWTSPWPRSMSFLAPAGRVAPSGLPPPLKAGPSLGGTSACAHGRRAAPRGCPKRCAPDRVASAQASAGGGASNFRSISFAFSH